MNKTKKIQILILLVLVNFSTNALSKKTAWDNFNLKVKSIEYFKYKVLLNGKTQKSHTSDFKTIFDGNEKLIKHQNYTCEYDKTVNRTEKKDHNSNGVLINKHTWRFN